MSREIVFLGCVETPGTYELRGRDVGSESIKRSAVAEDAEMVLDVVNGEGGRLSQIETAREYAATRLERGDVIDVALDSAALIVGVWIHVYYQNEELRPTYYAQMPNRKSDALFAARVLVARHSEAQVSRGILAAAGHVTAPLHDRDGNGEFRLLIDYGVTDRRAASHDLTCKACGKHFEVKARSHDLRRRVSHSPRRPFDADNAADDYHVFHYRSQGRFEVLRNSQISAALRQVTVTRRSGEQDSWGDIGFEGDPKLPALTAAEYRCAQAARR